MDLTARDAARMLNVSEEQIHAWIRGGMLPSYRIKDRFRLNRVELLEWAAARGIKVAPEFFHESPEPAGQLLLTGALQRGGIHFDVACTDKSSALRAVCALPELPSQVDRDELHGVLLAREDLCSTGIGKGVAIPHPRGPIVMGLSEPIVTLMFLRQAIDFKAIDGKPVDILFLIISTTVRVHLSLLSHLMFALQDGEFRELLDRRAGAPRILATLAEVERHMLEINPSRESPT